MEQSMIYVVSDSVGETADLVTKAAVSQFSGENIVLKRIPFVEDVSTIDEVLSLAEINNGVIAYTLVKPEIRSYMKEKAAKMNVVAYDIIGPLIDILEQKYGTSALNKPGLVRKLDENYFKRVEAIEFAVKYDDGRDPKGILKADVILLGVSRTSKTPLSQFLAHKRVKVANVPLVPEVEPPEELFNIDPNKCIGLRISADKLNHIRKERLKSLGLNDNAVYANMERIQEELDYFDRIVNRLNCPVVDVTNKAVEETANIIIDIIMRLLSIGILKQNQ